MKVFNYLINDSEIYINILLKELANNNINYLIIDYNLYYEIHFEDKIYRLFDINRNSVTQKEKRTFFDSILDNNIPNNKVGIKKERPGYKRLTKKDIKNSNRKNNYKKVI